MILQSVQAILVEFRYGCVIVQGNNSVLNCSRKWLQEQYQKHQLMEFETNRTNHRPTKNICLARPRVIKQPKAKNEWTNKRDQQLGKAKQNRMSKPNNQPNKWSQTSHQTRERLRSQLPSNEVRNRWEFWIRG